MASGKSQLPLITLPPCTQGWVDISGSLSCGFGTGARLPTSCPKLASWGVSGVKWSVRPGLGLMEGTPHTSAVALGQLLPVSKPAFP
jgi:hypothetical protein